MNRTTFGFLRVLLCGLFLLFAVGSANAQFKAGIQGTVTDTAGGRVPGAAITLTNKETSKTQTTTANEEGFYRFSQLAPGSYNLSAEKSGCRVAASFARDELHKLRSRRSGGSADRPDRLGGRSLFATGAPSRDCCVVR